MRKSGGTVQQVEGDATHIVALDFYGQINMVAPERRQRLTSMMDRHPDTKRSAEKKDASS